MLWNSGNSCNWVGYSYLRYGNRIFWIQKWTRGSLCSRSYWISQLSTWCLLNRIWSWNDKLYFRISKCLIEWLANASYIRIIRFKSIRKISILRVWLGIISKTIYKISILDKKCTNDPLLRRKSSKNKCLRKTWSRLFRNSRRCFNGISLIWKYRQIFGGC